MTKLSSRNFLLATSTLALAVVFGDDVAAQTGYVPNFQSGPGGWQRPFGGEFPAVPGYALPVSNDPAHPNISNEMARINGVQPTYRIGDISNANLKQWAKDAMKKDNDEVLAGKIAFTPGQSCQPQGIPAYLLSQGPVLFLQTPTKVVILEESSQQIRHVYMNVPHSANVKPSWLGESVGHYEGDTLVVDTVGLNTKTFIDSFRTPHSDKLHVIERYRIVDGGNTLQVRIRIEDPDTFYQPWETYVMFRKGRQPLSEDICQEGNFNVFDYGIPKAAKADF
jgi:hypothetical protein